MSQIRELLKMAAKHAQQRQQWCNRTYPLFARLAVNLITFSSLDKHDKETLSQDWSFIIQRAANLTMSTARLFVSVTLGVTFSMQSSVCYITRLAKVLPNQWYWQLFLLLYNIWISLVIPNDTQTYLKIQSHHPQNEREHMRSVAPNQGFLT